MIKIRLFFYFFLLHIQNRQKTKHWTDGSNSQTKHELKLRFKIEHNVVEHALRATHSEMEPNSYELICISLCLTLKKASRAWRNKFSFSNEQKKTRKELMIKIHSEMLCKKNRDDVYGINHDHEFYKAIALPNGNKTSKMIMIEKILHLTSIWKSDRNIPNR